VLREERASRPRCASGNDERPRQRRRAVGVDSGGHLPVHRPPRPAATTVAAATLMQPVEAHGGTQQRPPEEICPGGPREGRIRNILEEDDEDTHVPMHTFHVPVRVPCFLLDSSFATLATDSLTGIATSSRVDDTGQEFPYPVHLESGHSLEINVGCLEIILPGLEGFETHGGPRRAEVESQELQTHGRYSSCKEETDHEVDEWPIEMLHNPDFYNFSWTSRGTAGCVEEADTDSEIARVAESLQGEGICSRHDAAQRGRGTAALQGRRPGRPQGHGGHRGRQRATDEVDINVDSPMQIWGVEPPTRHVSTTQVVGPLTLTPLPPTMSTSTGPAQGQVKGNSVLAPGARAMQRGARLSRGR
jgi:hypothetical protein